MFRSEAETLPASASLTADEALRRLGLFGPNTLPPARGLPVWRKILRAVRDPLVLVLLGAIAMTLLTKDIADTIVIALVIVVNTTLAVRQEIRADQAVSALGRLVAPVIRLIRDDEEVSRPVAELVPGDLVVLAEGDLVPADSLLVGGASLQVDESALTGESMAVDKAPAADPGPGPLAAQPTTSKQMTDPAGADSALYSGTIVVHGRGLARVIATGSDSELGRIASMLRPQPRPTPLQQRMAQLSRYLATGAVGLCALVMGLGLANGQPFELMLLTAVSLAVAAVPESLPVVVTVSLAMAARRMAERHAIVRNLAAVETLGSVTMLATDKTGTLTQARMTVTDIWWPEGRDERTLMRAVALCNDAALDASGTSLGDPTEMALLRAAAARGVAVKELRASCPRLSELPFDSSRKRMMTVHRCGDEGVLMICKGAPESLLDPNVLCDESEHIEEALRLSRSMAATGGRVIAVAHRREAADDATMSELGMSLLGLVQLQDPLRPSSLETITACHEAGIDVALITGDHPATAASIAAQVGIATDTEHVVARATPADKLALVQAWQEAGHVVAMTGDGVNDGPALRRADIGVAMGERGTEVARQSADLIISNDDLGTVVAAVEEGRRVYANIRRFLLYGLSGGAAEILLMLLGPIFGAPLPLLPAQILWVNLLTHSFAGAALGTEPVEIGTMARPPRDPREGVLGGGLWWRIATVAAVLGAASLCVNLAAGSRLGSSAALLSLGAGQLGVAWGVRARARRPRSARLFSPMPLAMVGAALLLIGSVTIVPLRSLLSTHEVPPVFWGLAVLTALTAYACSRWLRPRAL